jgi:hypothetical protein
MTLAIDHGRGARLDTYDTTADAEKDKAQQQSLLDALDASPSALRRDECGAWAIRGSRGIIHTWGDGRTWVMYTACRSGQSWTWAKKRLAFADVTQDGDDEGAFRLVGLPTPEQAIEIRDILGVRKRLAPEAIEQLRQRALQMRAALARGADENPDSGATVGAQKPENEAA